MPLKRSYTRSRPLSPAQLDAPRRRGARPSRCWSGRRRRARSGSAALARAVSSSSIVAEPVSRSVSPSRVVSATPRLRVQSTPCASDSASARSSALEVALAGDDAGLQLAACAGPRGPRGCAGGPCPRGGRRRVRPSLAAPGLARPRARRRRAREARTSVGHVVDLVPAAGRVEAEHQPPSVVLAERVLELVAVAPGLDGGHDRLDGRLLEAADARQRLAHLRLLLASWRS